MIIDISTELYVGRTEWRYEYGVLQTSNYDQKKSSQQRSVYKTSYKIMSAIHPVIIEDIALYKRVRQQRAIHTPLVDDVLQAQPSNPSGIRLSLASFV
jgi:hypothetical protein